MSARTHRERAGVSKDHRRRSPRPTPAERCPFGAKIRFATRDDAERELAGAALMARHGGGRPQGPIRSYECPRCGGWHLTSQPDFGQEP